MVYAHNVSCSFLYTQRLMSYDIAVSTTFYTHTHSGPTRVHAYYLNIYIYIIRSCAKDAYINVRELHVFEFSRGTYYNIYYVQSHIGVVHDRKVFGTQLGGVSHILYIYI